MERAPNFVVDWEPRWPGFRNAIRPAFSRSAERLSIECSRAAGTPRSFGASLVVHVIGVIAVILVWPLLGTVGTVPLELRSIDDYEVVYYRSNELPIVGDQAGAREGASGNSGGREAYHPTQVIRVARGESPSSLVASVPPTMKLQLSTKDLANLLVLSRALPEGPKAAPVPPEPPKPEPLKVQTMTAQKKLVAPKPVAAPGFQQFSRTNQDPKLVLPTSPNVKLTPTVNTESAQVNGSLSTLTQQERTSNAEFHAPTESLVAKGGGGDSERGADGDAMETAIVMSIRPGTTLGAPGVDINGAFTASPNGRSGIGIGSGGGVGTGAGSGSGPGAGTTGSGPGSGSTGTGRGSDPKAVAGIAPGTGGGAGTGPAGAPRSGAGVSISGGSGGNGNIVMMPSFSTKSAPSIAPRGRNDMGGPAIIVVAAPRAGGGLSRYGELKGSKVYTTYLQTSLGTAILQYADPTSKEGDVTEDLIPPQPVKTEVPEGLSVGRLVISCVLTKAGMLRNPKVLEGPQPEMTTKVLETLAAWRFSPVVRGNQKVDVNVLLGFKIDTR